MSTATMNAPAHTITVVVPSVQEESPLESRLLVAANRVALAYTGLRVRVGRPRYQRRFTDDQLERATQPFGAEPGAVSMSKKLFNAREPAVKRIRKVFADILATIKDPEHTLPYPDEPGVRLVRRGHVDELDRQLTRLSAELEQAAAALQAELPAIARREAERLRQLFDPSDYQFNAEEASYVTWNFPALTTVDPALTTTSPRLSQKQQEHVQQMMQMACEAKEQEMAKAMSVMLGRLAKALEPTDASGKRQIFHDASVEKIFGALEHADQQLVENGIGSGPLKTAFDTLRAVVNEHRENLPEQLRNGDDGFRNQIKERFQEVGKALGALSSTAVRRARLSRRLPANHDEEVRAA